MGASIGEASDIIDQITGSEENMAEVMAAYEEIEDALT